MIGLGIQRPEKMVAAYDISKGEMTSPIWSYTTTFCTTISGFKFRRFAPYGEVVLMTGGKQAEMVSYDTKEVIWSTSDAPANAHSLEILPNGVMVVGGSSGNSFRFFNLNGKDPDKHKLEIEHPDAHGALWDPKNNVLWCAGSNMLFAYEVILNDDGSISVKKNEDLSVITPDGGLHDLQAYMGNPDMLILTTASHVYFYNKVTKTFADAYPDVEGAKTQWIRSAGVFENGDMFYTEHDGGDDNGQGGGWNTTFVYYIPKDTRTLTTISTTQGRFYKARIWSSEYQP